MKLSYSTLTLPQGIRTCSSTRYPPAHNHCPALARTLPSSSTRVGKHSCRTARAASRPHKSLSSRKPPTNENLDFGIQVFAPQKKEASQDTKHADEVEEIAAETVLLAPGRPSAPLSPASKKASRPQSRSLSEQSRAPQSPERLSQRGTAACDTVPKPQSLSTAPSNGADVLEPICIGVPVPHFLHSYPQAQVAEGFGAPPGQASALPTCPTSPVRTLSKVSASKSPTCRVDAGREASRRRSSSPGQQVCQSATTDARSKSRSRSPKLPHASQSTASDTTGNGRHAEVAENMDSRPRVRDRQPPSQSTRQGEGSASDQEQLAALLGCSPPKSSVSPDEATPQAAGKAVQQPSSSEEDSHHEEASLRHHARPNPEASLRTQKPEPRERDRCENQSPAPPTTLGMGQSYQQVSDRVQSGVPRQFQIHASESSADISVQRQPHLKTMTKQPDAEEQYSDPAVGTSSTAGTVHATSSEPQKATAMPASIRFSTTTEQGIGALHTDATAGILYSDAITCVAKCL